MIRKAYNEYCVGKKVYYEYKIYLFGILIFQRNILTEKLIERQLYDVKLYERISLNKTDNKEQSLELYEKTNIGFKHDSEI